VKETAGEYRGKEDKEPLLEERGAKNIPAKTLNTSRERGAGGSEVGAEVPLWVWVSVTFEIPKRQEAI